MEQGIEMVGKLYEKDVYKKERCNVYQVPCDTNITGFDRYPMDQAEGEREALMKATRNTDPALLEEFRLLMRHHRSGLLRDEFVRCLDSSCSICSGKPPTEKTELDQILQRFPSRMIPTPVPALLPGPDHPSMRLLKRRPETRGDDEADSSSSDDSDCGEGAAVSGNRKKRSGRYRTLIDLLKISLPPRCFYPDAFYSGEAVLLRCPECPKPLEVFKTKSGLERHRKLCHAL